jgi:PAS domain S-box-containing protein
MRMFRPVIPRKFAISVHVVLSFLIIVIILIALKFLPGTFKELYKIDDTITAAEHTMKLLVDMETGQRGFLAFGKQKFLEPYDRGQRDLPSSFSRLAGLVNGNAILEPHLKQARTLADQWEANAAAEIQQKKTRADFGLTFNPDVGKDLMDSIRGQFADLIQAGQDQRSAVGRRAAYIVFLLLLTAGIALVAIVVSGRNAIQIQKELEVSAHYATQIREQLGQLRVLQQLVDEAHDAIIVRDSDSRVLTWNKGAETLYGWTAEEARGRVTHELFHTDHPVGRKELLEGGGFFQGRLEHESRTGDKLVVESRQVLTRTTDGGQEKEDLLEINRDITKDVKLLKDVNHDLKNCVEEINAWTSVALRQESFDKVKNQLNIIRAAAFHMKLVLADMVANYEGNAKIEEFTLNALCENLSPQLIAPELRKPQSSNFKVILNCDGNLLLTTDRPKLFRCLFNLLLNAFKHSHAQNITLQITPTANHHLMFAVIDDGNGIPEAKRQNVLAALKGQARSGAGGETGRGLSIAQQYAERLGGSLRLADEGPHGCRFELIIPVSVEAGGEHEGIAGR